MNDDDLALRNLTYACLAEFGRVPTAAEMAGVAGRGRAKVMAGWERPPSKPVTGRFCAGDEST